MGTEIERKFLVDAPKLLSYIAQNRPEKEHITQGYLRDTAPYVRVRITNKAGVITVKGEGTIEREEVNVEISKADAQAIITMCPMVLRKTRYKIPVTTYARFNGGSSVDDVEHVWDVDVFHDKLNGLIVAEIELRAQDEQFDKPEWVGQEVTEDGRYANVNLIKATEPPTP